ncbi:hypothetical protein, partial [Escherichia coli]|uniref:hypothetical protein n=1 Tax=Escherichia coli TaxID=562 RepID=UPI000BC768FF
DAGRACAVPRHSGAGAFRQGYRHRSEPDWPYAAINDTLFPIAQTALNGATLAEPAPYRDIQGLEHFDKVIDIDQSPIGRTPR